MALSTPFGYFRPLCAITYWIDWHIWGATPAGFRFTGLVLAALVAALVVVVTRRYTGDAALAGLAGLLFSLHPYHVGAIAWVAARSDLLSALLMLVAAWSFDRWSDRPRALPFAAILLYEAALLAKESSVVLVAFLFVVALFDRKRRFRGMIWVRAFLPLTVVSLLHFTVLRAAVLGGTELRQLNSIGAWRGNLFSYGASSVVPLPSEMFQERSWLWGGVAMIVALTLLAAARLRKGKLPGVIWPTAVAFTVLLGPSLIAFVQRYYYLPSAAAALALAALLRAAGIRVGGWIAGTLAVVWIGTAVALWSAWFDAGTASRQLIARLVEISKTGDVETIVIAGSPHRVHGVPVTGAFERIVPFLGGRQVSIRTAAEFDYPTPGDDALAKPLEQALAAGSEPIDLELVVERGRYSRYVWPRIDEGDTRILEDGVSLRRDGRDRLRVRITPRAGLRAYVWSGGDITPIHRLPL